ncbi:TIGR02266 family protein [Cystobacter fuscus]|uniref:TIGR02266 family protein n=1 Tax=Cystobacter fuscus TaxID=43 RepID=UPI002B304DE8|nr:TIGR02266 family protein [Cystobacter fuscus]
MTVEPKLLPLRIRLPYATEEEFIVRYGAYVARGGLFLATRTPKPEGTKLLFELVLADGGRLLRGEGVVVKSQADGPRAGMTVRFVRLDVNSKALIDRVMDRKGQGPATAKPPFSPDFPTPEEAPAVPAAPAPPPAETTRKGRPVISAEALRRQAERMPIPGSSRTPSREGIPIAAPVSAEPLPAPEPPVSFAPEPPALVTPEPPVPLAPEPPVLVTPEPPVPEFKGRRRAILDVVPVAPVTAAPRDVVLGIDLGTTWARAAVHHQGTLQLIPVGGAQALPSLLAVNESGQLLVGEAARAEAERSPGHALPGLRRLLGVRARSPLMRALSGPLPFALSTSPQGDASIDIRGRQFLLPELAAQLLRELKSAASSFLGHDAARTVLCVPAHFDDRQRAAMREAATLAGLEVLRILNAPSAAALAFGHGRGLARKRLLVVELGGGGLDVSVVQLTGDDLEVITTGGDPTLGGMDFDARIAEALATARQAQGLPRPEHPSDWAELLLAAESAKVALSEREEVSLPMPGDAPPFVLTRQRLDTLTEDLVQRLTLVVRQVLESSALTPQGLDEVLLLGSQGRAPLVRRGLEEALGVPVRTDVGAEHPAALGAALLGQGLLDAEKGKPGATVSEVLSVPVGVAERGGGLRRVLERDTRLPAEKTLVIPVTAGPLALALFQGPSLVAVENEFLGTLSLTPERPGEAEVHFSLSQDGLLSLAVTLPGVKRQPVPLAAQPPEDAEWEALLSRSPFEGEPGTRPGGLLSGLRKLFGRR